MLGKILPLGALVIAFTGSAWAQDAAALLNKANQINYEETETAKLAHRNAGDNQALMTYADTVKGDHEANEEAVSSLSRQKSIKLDGTDSAKVDNSPLRKLRGGAFNQAYVEDQVKGHKEALGVFERAKSEFKGDRDMELYVDQTIPVLEAHLKMAENLERMSRSSEENPANNRSTTKGMGESARD